MAEKLGATSTTDDVLSGIDLRGKRILVTGVSAGLGVETARSLAAHGANVVGAARDLGAVRRGAGHRGAEGALRLAAGDRHLHRGRRRDGAALRLRRNAAKLPTQSLSTGSARSYNAPLFNQPSGSGNEGFDGSGNRRDRDVGWLRHAGHKRQGWQFASLSNGQAFGTQTYNTTSSAWQGVFGKMTPQQVDAIAAEIFAEIENH